MTQTTVGPALSWRLVHDGQQVLSLDQSEGYTTSIHTVFEVDTEAACTAELVRLGIQTAEPVLAVTMRQARLALLGTGLLAQVNAAIAAMPGTAGDAARIEWEFSSEVKRHQPLVQALGPVLGMSEAQLDALFIKAGEL